MLNNVRILKEERGSRGHANVIKVEVVRWCSRSLTSFSRPLFWCPGLIPGGGRGDSHEVIDCLLICTRAPAASGGGCCGRAWN